MKWRSVLAAVVLTLLAPPLPAQRQSSLTHLPSRLAVFAVPLADANELTAVASALEVVGVGFETTSELEVALQAPLVVLAGTLTNKALSAAERERLYAYVEAGGVVFASHVQGNQFFPLFGLAAFATSRENFRLRFVAAEADPVLRFLNQPEEQEIRFGDPGRFEEVDWTSEYTLGRAQALGHYPNGAVGFMRNYYGRGVAYSLGISFADSTLRPALGQSYEAQPQWVNVFAPSADVVRLLLRALYESTAHPFVLIRAIPDGRETALILSHDIDAREAFRYSRAFADLEERYGVTSTFFVTTKYFTDATDIGYYTEKTIALLRALRARGFDLGSHSVSHLMDFDRFPLGTTEVRFESYRPLEAPTVLGEVIVSKELLERDIADQRTVSFRAGFLRHPPRLIQALEQGGYRVDSTQAAGNTLTNFPYRAFRATRLGAPLTDIIEIPVTLDDSRGYLTADNVAAVVAEWKRIIEANRENGAVTCLLIHPTDITYKLEAERRLLEAYQNQPVWIGDVTRFGLFARGRAPVRVTAFEKEGRLLLRLNRRRARLPAGLTLALRAELPWTSVQLEDSQGEAIPFARRVRRGRQLLVLQP